MPIDLDELADSRSFTRTAKSVTVTRKFVARYSSSETAVYAAVLAGTPAVFDGYLRQRIGCEPKGAGVWAVEVEYGFSPTTQDTSATVPDPSTAAPGDADALGPEYAFDLTAKQAHVTQSFETKYRWEHGDDFANGSNLTVDASDNTKVTPVGYPPDPGGDPGKTVYIGASPGWAGGAYTILAVAGGKWVLDRSPAAVGTAGGTWVFAAGTGGAPDYKQAIGVTSDRVEGTDVFAPAVEFSITCQIPALTLSYIRVLRAAAATTNSAVWRRFAAGEVLYLGASGQCGPDNNWKLTHKFAAGENRFAVRLSADLVLPVVGAWEYVWAAYKTSADVTAGVPAIVQTPSALYVERVYRSSNFNLLGLGT